MKANLLKISALAIVVGLAAVACKKAETDVDAPVLTITASSTTFSNNAATATLSLSAASSKDVAVSLEATGSLAQAVTFTKDVTIAAGSVSLPVDVTVNPDGLAAGTYAVEIAIAKANGAEISSSAKSVTLSLTIEGDAAIEVNMDAPASFTDGAAVLKLYPSEAPEVDITVTLALGTQVKADGATLIAESALTFSKTVTLPAGSDADVEVPVTVDMDVLGPGLNEAVITIASVSEGVEIGDKNEAHITVEGYIQANNRTDWSVVYNGTQDGLDNVAYTVGSETQNWYAFYFAKGFVATNFEDMTEFVRYMAYEEINPYVGTDEAYTVRKGNTTLKYNRFPVGAYEFFLLGADADGYLTGDYATTSITLEATPGMTATYEKWLGEWEVNHKIWTIEKANATSLTYKVTIEGSEDYPIEANLGWENELQVRNQTAVTETVGFVGLTSSYNFWYGSHVIASAAYADESTTLEAGKAPDGSASFAYLSFVNFSTMSIISMITVPTEMARPSDLIIDDTPVKAAAYSDFIGTWNYNGYELTIAQLEEGSTYSVAGLPGGNYYDLPVATFANGVLTVAEQDLGDEYPDTNYGSCRDFLQGAFAYNNKEYGFYPYNANAPGTVICTFEMHESGNFTITAGSCTYGTFVCMRLGWVITDSTNQYYGKGNAEDGVYFNEAAAVKVEATQASHVKKNARRFNATGNMLSRNASMPRIHAMNSR